MNGVRPQIDAPKRHQIRRAAGSWAAEAWSVFSTPEYCCKCSYSRYRNCRPAHLLRSPVPATRASCSGEFLRRYLINRSPVTVFSGALFRMRRCQISGPGASMIAWRRRQARGHPCNRGRSEHIRSFRYGAIALVMRGNADGRAHSPTASPASGSARPSRSRSAHRKDAMRVTRQRGRRMGSWRPAAAARLPLRPRATRSGVKFVDWIMGFFLFFLATSCGSRIRNGSLSTIADQYGEPVRLESASGLI